MSLFNELKRRNVFRVAIAYVVISWLLIQVIGLAAESFEAPVWVMKMIITLIAIGFIPTLFFSWAFEITAEGIKKESEINRDASITNITAKKLNIITIVAITLVVGIIAADRFFPKPASTASNTVVSKTEMPKSESNNSTNITKTINDNSIAVLPFSDLSQKGDQEYFSDGMAEEILNVLVRVDSLEVASRTSAFQFKGMDIGIPEIAKKLRVRHVLEGSVRKSGKTIRITAQLIDAQNDKHLWSNTYDRPLTTNNIFAIQDEISQAIVKELSNKLGIKSITPTNVKQSTENLNAYELYLKARPLFLSRVNLNAAVDYLQKAVELDPNYAKAWELKAATQILIPSYGYSTLTPKELDARAEEYANKALALEPNSALALSSLAFMRQQSTFKLRKVYPITDIMEAFDKSIQIDPFNPTSYNWRGLHYMAIGNLEAGLTDFKKCKSLENNYLPCVSNIIEVNAELGKDEEALMLLEEALNKSLVQPSNINLGFLARNNKSLAFKLVTNDRKMLFGFKRHKDLYLAFKNPQQDHQQLIQDIVDFIAKDSRTLQGNLYMLLLPIGGYDAEPFLPFIWGAENKSYRQSKQFEDWIFKSGIFDYWKETNFPSQCRPLGDDDFECD
jgi:TolB-like protein